MSFLLGAGLGFLEGCPSDYNLHLLNDGPCYQMLLLIAVLGARNEPEAGMDDYDELRCHVPRAVIQEGDVAQMVIGSSRCCSETMMPMSSLQLKRV